MPCCKLRGSATISTDDSSHHVHCDPSWCIFKRAIDKGKSMPPYSSMQNYIHLPKQYEDRVRDVFQDFSSLALLERCLKGQTQNRNKELHSKLWLHQSKSKFTGLKQVIFIHQVTVIEHNFGYQANRFLQFLGFTPIPNAFTSKKQMDKRNTSRVISKQKS